MIWIILMTPQPNKPHKRTARDAGLTNQPQKPSSNKQKQQRVNYSYIYTEKPKRNLKPVAGVIVALLVVALGAYGFTHFGGQNPGSDQNAGQTQTSTNQEQSGTIVDNGENGNTEKSGNEHSSDAEKAGAANKTDADKADSYSGNGSSKSSKSKKSSNGSDGGNATDADSGGTTNATVIDHNNGNNDVGSSSSAAVGTTTTDSGNASSGSSSSSSKSSSSKSSGSKSKSSSSSSSKSSGKLSTYYSALDSSSDELKSFVDDTYNAHLYGKLSQRKADYKQFKKMKKRLLADLTKANGNWNIESVKASGKLSKAKKNLIKASNLLKQRLQIIENGYKAVNALGKNASKKAIDKANNSACADSGPTYEQFIKLMEKVSKQLG